MRGDKPDNTRVMGKTVKKFYDALVTRFDIEEAWAERQLKKVTR